MKTSANKFIVCMSLLFVLSFVGIFACVLSIILPHNHTHEYELNEIVVEATCQHAGQAIYKCSCGDEVWRDIPTLEHKFEETKILLATCSSEGLTHRVCSLCNFEEDVVVTKLEHVWDGGLQTKFPTCTDMGEITYTCTECNATKIETQESLGHHFISGRLLKEPTCHSKGILETTCNRPGCTQTSTIEIDTVDHVWVDGTITIPPTCDKEGVMTYKCKFDGCEEKKTEVVDALGHNYSSLYTVDVSPTCSSYGMESQHCTNPDCNSSINSRIVDKTAHDFNGDTCRYCGVNKNEVEQILFSMPAIVKREYELSVL